MSQNDVSINYAFTSCNEMYFGSRLTPGNCENNFTLIHYYLKAKITGIYVTSKYIKLKTTTPKSTPHIYYITLNQFRGFFIISCP